MNIGNDSLSSSQWGTSLCIKCSRIRWAAAEQIVRSFLTGIPPNKSLLTFPVKIHSQVPAEHHNPWAANKKVFSWRLQVFRCDRLLQAVFRSACEKQLHVRRTSVELWAVGGSQRYWQIWAGLWMKRSRWRSRDWTNIMDYCRYMHQVHQSTRFMVMRMLNS